MFSVGKRALVHVDPFTLATVRYAAGIFLLILLLVAVEGRQALRYGGRFLPAAAFGLVGVAGFNLFVWIGLRFTLPEHASVILALQTPLTAIAVWLVRGQRPSAFTLGCVVAAIGGVLMVVTRGDPAGAIAHLGQDGALLGDVMVLLGGVSWVIYVLAAPHFAGWSSLRMTVLTCVPGLAGLIGAHLVALAIGWASLPSAEAIGATGWHMLYLSVCTVALGILGFNNSARTIGPLNTMLMLNIIPVLVFGIEAALGRRFAPVELVGAGIVVGALVANNLYLRGISTRR